MPLRVFPAPLSRIGWSALLCAIAVSACATQHDSPAKAKENAAMTAESPTVAEPVAFGAKDLSKRVLALIEGIRDIRDISPESIEKLTGLKIEVNPKDSNDYGTTGKLTDTWYYGLRSMSPDASDKPNRLLFELNDQTDTDADMSPVCVPIEDYSQALTAAGFASRKMRNRLDTQDYWEFTRGDVGATVYVRGKSDPHDAQTCVSMVIIETYL
jgi:hypothetical protein